MTKGLQDHNNTSRLNGLQTVAMSTRCSAFTMNMDRTSIDSFINQFIIYLCLYQGSTSIFGAGVEFFWGEGT